MARLAPHDVVCVVVTYGRRKTYLRQVVEALQRDGVGAMLLVDNGADWDVAGWAQVYGDWIRVLRMVRNLGSSGGFAQGIAAALDTPARMVWLLDDDNVPEPSCLSALLAVYAQQRRDTSADRLAVLAYRPSHHVDLGGEADSVINARPSSFQGLHIRDLPTRAWRRLRLAKGGWMQAPPSMVQLDVAPYGGLLFGREVAEAIGLPRADLLLYADDTEYTYRITHRGGRILLLTAARVVDVESSWNARSSGANSFQALLAQGSELRAYYGMRNRSWFDRHCLARSPLMLRLNVWAYLAILSVYAVRSGHFRRYRLLREAIRDGLAGRLGADPRFPLP